MGVASRTLRARAAVLAAQRQTRHRRGRRTVLPPAQRSRAPASATGRRVARAAGGVAAADLVAEVADSRGERWRVPWRRWPARRTRTREGAPAAPQPSGAAQSADTIDALFAPLPPVESRGRVWTFADKQLKPVDVRLGITDGTFTELLDGESLSVDAQVVTGMTGLGTRAQATPAAAGQSVPAGRARRARWRRGGF